MPGIRRISEQPERYLVTFCSATVMDNCKFTVVEVVINQVPPSVLLYCRTHKGTKCVCIALVRRHRELEM